MLPAESQFRSGGAVVSTGFAPGAVATPGLRLWGYIDARGGWAIEPQFKVADDFDGDLARAETIDGAGYVDRRGRRHGWSAK